VSIGAYTVTGTRARAAFIMADAGDVCRLDMAVVFLVRAVVLGKLLRMLKEDK